MANTRLNNVIYVDTGSAQVETAYNQKIYQIILTSNAAGDELVLKEVSGGATKLALKNGVAQSSQVFDFPTPLVFTQGIYVSSISSSAKAMLVVGTGNGGN